MPPPQRTDQIGSLLRPAWLLQARSSLSSPSQMYEVTNDIQIQQAETQAIQEAVQKQLELNIRPICSGEYSRHIFYGGFFEKLEGMTPQPALPIPEAFRTDFPTTTGLAAKLGARTRAAVVCTGPIRWRRSAYLPEWEAITSALPEREMWKEAKMTLPAPSYQHMQLAPGTAFTAASGYATDAAYFAALGEAYVREIEALYAAGCRQIAIDDPHLTYFCLTQFLGGCEKDGIDPDALLDLYLESHNGFLRAKPGASDLHMGMHLCRGNVSGSTHWVTGSYDRIAEKLFTQTQYETYYLEFDDEERDGGFECLRFLPRGKNVVLGLVSTKQAELEDPEGLRTKIDQAVQCVAEGQGVSKEQALDCLALSPQCGFSSSSLAGGKEMTMERMWEKLALVRSVAQSVWKDAR
ncbi:UROD/MetE-like protein [Hortaea werneckii]|nr:UROD/MetE-like protein [Hortaea werneckii]